MNVTLNGRDYPLRFSVNALCCLEEKTGLDLSRLRDRQMSCLRGLLWCGLMDSGAPVTLEEAGDLLDRHLKNSGDLKTVSASLAAALEDACFFPTRAGTGPKRTNPSGPATGA